MGVGLGHHRFCVPEWRYDCIERYARLKRAGQRARRPAIVKMGHPVLHSERREELVGGQSPFAVILSCSDSRVPPELIFDQGLGGLFVVRIAGNTVTRAGLEI